MGQQIQNLTAEELAGLIAIDGTIRQKRPQAEIEIRLRLLGLIDRNSISRLPIRTKRGQELVRELRGE